MFHIFTFLYFATPASILKNSRKTTEVVERPKALGDIRGISYIYPILWRLELIRVPEKFEKKMACDDEKNAKG